MEKIETNSNKTIYNLNILTRILVLSCDCDERICSLTVIGEDSVAVLTEYGVVVILVYHCD